MRVIKPHRVLICYALRDFWVKTLGQQCDHIFNYLKRVLATYLLALAAAAVFLTLFDKAPWDTALLVTVRRMIIVAFPASMSATISDVIK